MDAWCHFGDVVCWSVDCKDRYVLSLNLSVSNVVLSSRKIYLDILVLHGSVTHRPFPYMTHFRYRTRRPKISDTTVYFIHPQVHIHDLPYTHLQSHTLALCYMFPFGYMLPPFSQIHLSNPSSQSSPLIPLYSPTNYTQTNITSQLPTSSSPSPL